MTPHELLFLTCLFGVVGFALLGIALVLILSWRRKGGSGAP